MKNDGFKMNINRLITIIDKEWNEVFRNKAVVFTVFFMPVLFTFLPLFMLYITSSQLPAGGDTTDMPAIFAQTCGNLTANECSQVFLANQFLVLFMIMPMTIPIAIAAYSVVGEKTTRSLEPLLATPVTTLELLLGKCLSSSIPGVAAAWICFLLFFVLMPLTGVSAGVRASLTGPVWLGAVFLIGPLLSVFSVFFALTISSRVSDPRTAEQISVVIILPLLGIIFGQMGGLLVIDQRLVWVSAIILAALDCLAAALAVRLFRRETILTKWK